jgi:broad specificity phosphatase PhoE
VLWQVRGVQEEVQLREQDFGNFQDHDRKQREKAERLRFGRFFYRFPNGESGADVYDRITIFEDHMIRDINAGRFADHTNLVLVTHGLALRIFLMRWFHWTVDQFLNVWNPSNAEPLVLERVEGLDPQRAAWMHTKSLYRLSEASRESLNGCTQEMCATSCLPLSVQEAEITRIMAEAQRDKTEEETWAEYGGGAW